MREGWEVKKLGDVCEVLNGYAFKSKDTIEKSNTQLLRMGNLYQNKLDLERKPVFYPDNFIDDYSDYVLSENDLIMSLTGTVDKTDYGYTVRVKSSKVNLLLNQRIMKISVLYEQELNDKYLHLFLLSPTFLESLYATANGTRQANLSSKTILTLNIPIPPLPEQTQIVKTLDHAFAQIDQAKANLEKNLANAKELFQSKLNEVFSQRGEGWVEKTWNDVLEIRSGRNQKEVESSDGKYPILGSAGKIMGYANKYICEENTTIIGRKGTINNPLKIKTKFWNVDTAFGLHALSELDKDYLFYFCKNFNFKELDKGSGRPSLVKSDLLKIKMQIPTFFEQTKIVHELDKINKISNNLQTHYQQKLNNLEELKKSILEKAFRGA